MELKYNEATINRPEGTRLLDGRILFTDLAEIVEQLRSEKAWDTNDLNGITIFKNDQLTEVVTLMKEGTFVKRGPSDSGITLLVLKGRLRVDTDQEQYLIAGAQVLQLNPMMPHGITALEETIVFQVTQNGKTGS